MSFALGRFPWSCSDTEFRSSYSSLTADCALWHFRFRPPPLAQYQSCSTSATRSQCNLSAVRRHYFHTIPVVISELVLDSLMMRWCALCNAHGHALSRHALSKHINRAFMLNASLPVKGAHAEGIYRHRLSSISNSYFFNSPRNSSTANTSVFPTIRDSLL